jgi:hypothetical protein
MARPLSQTGFHRLPKNPHQRAFGEGGTKKATGSLDKINEKLVVANVTVHPTKGIRRYNPVRTAAAVLASEIRNGLAPFSMKLMRRELRLARLNAGDHG